MMTRGRKTSSLVASLLAVAACGKGDKSISPEKLAACEQVLAELSMPFKYEASAVGVTTEGVDGSPLPLIFGPWGAHNSPHTGHPVGNGKADMSATFANGPDEMQSFDGTPCDVYDQQAPNCGLPLAETLARRPFYILPNEFSSATLAKMAEHDITYEINEVFVKAKGTVGAATWHYFDSPDQWEVSVRICGYGFGLGHLGSIAPELKEILVDRGVTWNFDDYDGPMNLNLLGSEPITTLPPGTPMGYPQLVGKPVPAEGGQSTAYARPENGSSVLWAQIEFGTFRYDLITDKGFFTPSYKLLSAHEQAVWEAALHAEMDNPNSARYGNSFAIAREWLWRAEGKLRHTPEFEPEGTENGLLRRLGDWWESYDGCGESDIKCDEVVAFNRIDRDSPAFEPSFYEADSQYIFWWLRTAITPQDGYYGEVLSTEGNLLSDATGTMLVRWRNFNGGAPIDGSMGTHAHQRIAWRLGNSDTLKLAWGASAAAELDAEIPTVPAADAECNGTTLTCHTGMNANVRTDNIDGQL